MFSCYTTVYIYYMFIVFTGATYLMTDEPPYCTVYIVHCIHCYTLVYSCTL